MQVTRPPPGGRLTTYARKKGRSRVLQTSSPARATDGEDISVVEMANRMQKRAWQSMNSACPVLERDLTNQEKFSKRPKNAHAVASTLSSDSDGTRPSPVFPLDSLTSLTDGTNNVQSKTPFNLSPASSPTAPDPMSPVPPSRRHISRPASRNLKENRSVIRLASPFHSCSVSKACSRSGSRTNSPRKKVKKPPFYIKARTRSETNAHPGESVADEIPFPVSGSLPTLGSMKASVCDRHPADGSTVYMLQDLSEQDWFTPAKALSRSPFPDDYIPPGTPFQEWDYSAEPFLGGIPLQTSTPNVVKDAIRRYISTDAAPNPPPSHALGDVIHNTTNSFDVGGLEHGRRHQRHFNHDSIFSSSFDSKTFSTSIIPSNCMNTERSLQDDSDLLTAYSSDPGKAVINLSGMLDCLDIDGMKDSSPNLVQRSRSLDSTQNTGPNSSPSAARQTAGRRRDRASTIRASDYIAKPAISLPSGGETPTSVLALTTRTRSGTIRPVRPPVASLTSGSPVATPQSCAGQEQTQSDTSDGPRVGVGPDNKLLGSPGSCRENSIQTSHFSRVQRTKHMALQVHDDESDDELLLDDRGWNWDGSWD